MLRSVLPVCRQASRQLQLKAQQPCRRFFGRPGRNLPIWYRKSMMDDVFPDRHMSPAKMMQDNFKLMERMVDDFFYPGLARTRGKEVSVKYNNQMYEVRVDVSQYDPKELNVKLADGNLTISAKHEEKPDEHGFISREFSRQFSVPEDVDADSLESLFTNDGYLVVRGNIKGAKEANERVIEIQREKPDPKPEEDK